MATKLIRGFHHLSSLPQGCIVTIGNFDGVHVGHKRLIDHLKNEAKRSGVPSMVMIFEPQPLEYFFKGRPQPRLTRFREKFYHLTKSGVDYVLVVPFNAQFAALTADEFIDQVLIGALKIKALVIGEDFHFGRGRQGNADLLKAKGPIKGFTVLQIPSIKVQDERVSSTRIRQALSDSNFALVEALLGRPFTLMGRVVFGNQLGRQLGFPTANIHLHRKKAPVQGIYAVWVHGILPVPLPGVANVGHRPTIGGTRTLLEVYLYDFDQNIYGRTVEVEFLKKFRDEEKFASLELLREQMIVDAALARAFFVERGDILKP